MCWAKSDIQAMQSFASEVFGGGAVASASAYPSWASELDASPVFPLEILRSQGPRAMIYEYLQSLFDVVSKRVNPSVTDSSGHHLSLWRRSSEKRRPAMRKCVGMP